MQTIRVLLVDDDQGFEVLTKNLLSRTSLNADLTWIADYDKAREAILQGGYDVCLLDHHLGGRSGLELLQVAQRHDVTMPIIMITGDEAANVDLESMQAGAADYIEKTTLNTRTLQRAITYAIERAQTHRALRASEERYRSLLTEAFDGILIADGEDHIVFANNKMSEMTGYAVDALPGMSLKALFKDSRRLLADLSSRGHLLESVLLRQDRGEVNVEISVNRLSNGETQLIIRDITLRKSALEERERNIERLEILHQVDDELSQILNINYVLSLALDATVRLSGADAGYIALLDSGKLTMAKALGHYAVASEENPFNLETPLVTKLIADSQPRLITDVTQDPDYIARDPSIKAKMLLPMMSYERMVGVINLETKRPERFSEEIFSFLMLIVARVAVAVENAQLYQISQDQLAELQELYEQVSKLEQIKTDMIRMASHDLRNPVGVVVGYVELLKRVFGGDDANQKMMDYVEMIDRSARRMKKIIEDILSLERIEKTIQDGIMDTVDLREVVEETFEDYKEQAAHKSQSFVVEVPPTILEVRGDYPQLREAVANLIGNAIKYTPNEGQVQVSVEYEAHHVVFKVVDSGYGIPENQQSKLFKPFFRANSKETEKIEGTGLGLHLIKNIVERHNGEIIFSSVYGEGSTFGFRLPLAN